MFSINHFYMLRTLLKTITWNKNPSGLNIWLLIIWYIDWTSSLLSETLQQRSAAMSLSPRHSWETRQRTFPFTFWNHKTSPRALFDSWSASLHVNRQSVVLFVLFWRSFSNNNLLPTLILITWHLSWQSGLKRHEIEHLPVSSPKLQWHFLWGVELPLFQSSSPAWNDNLLWTLHLPEIYQ